MAVPGHARCGSGGGGRTNGFSQLVAPGFLHVQGQRVGKQSLVLRGIHRRRLGSRQLIALGDAEVKSQALDAVQQFLAFHGGCLHPLGKRNLHGDHERHQHAADDAGQHAEHEHGAHQHGAKNDQADTAGYRSFAFANVLDPTEQDGAENGRKDKHRHRCENCKGHDFRRVKHERQHDGRDGPQSCKAADACVEAEIGICVVCLQVRLVAATRLADDAVIALTELQFLAITGQQFIEQHARGIRCLCPRSRDFANGIGFCRLLDAQAAFHTQLDQVGGKAAVVITHVADIARRRRRDARRWIVFGNHHATLRIATDPPPLQIQKTEHHQQARTEYTFAPVVLDKPAQFLA